MIPAEVKTLLDEQRTAWSEFKAINDRLQGEVKALGDGRTETKAALDKANGDLDRIEKRIVEIETKANRPAGVQIDPATGQPVPSEAKAAFLKWARYGGVAPEEQKHLVRATFSQVPSEIKALSIADATAAGYLAPPEYVREILKGETEFSPLRSVARVRTTSATSIKHPKRTGQFAAAWVAEQGTRAETTGLGYGLEEIPTHELYALVDVSNWMLEDSAFDLEAELRQEFAEQFGVAEGAALIGGNAVGKPEGITVNAAVVADAHQTATNDVLAADDLIDAFYKLKDAYAKNSTWVMRRATVGTIRKFVATTGDYLWQPGISGGTPSTILGQPYIEALDMPAVADGALAVAVGDFRRGYVIVDRIEIAVVRDPYTQATAGNVRFHARKRVGGQVVNAEAIQLIKIQ